ncbi:MAG TPA: hypothetical protein PLF01_00960 [Alphaproteobacteria bacterium]|nr:hypothetical protein [Alphaproteobacteria bacterium]
MSQRQRNRRQAHKGFVFFAFAALNIFCLVLGMALCLLKSPQDKAEIYMAMAQQYQDKAETEVLQPSAQTYLLKQSHNLVRQALGHNKYDASLWGNLSVILAKLDQIDLAMKARDIAVDLGAQELPAMMAMRTLLPARDLALSDTLDMQTTTR